MFSNSENRLMMILSVTLEYGIRWLPWPTVAKNVSESNAKKIELGNKVLLSPNHHYPLLTLSPSVVNCCRKVLNSNSYP